MSARPVFESKRYHFPPLWAVPLLFLGAIVIAFYWAWGIGPGAYVFAVILAFWILRRVDVYVRGPQRDQL